MKCQIFQFYSNFLIGKKRKQQKKRNEKNWECTFQLHNANGRKFLATSNSELLFKLKPYWAKVHNLEMSSYTWKGESEFFLSFSSQ